MAARDLIDSGAGTQIGQAADHAPLMQAEAVLHAQAAARGQHAEVGIGADADVGRVVPLVGQAFVYGHASPRNGEAVLPVGKVGEGDDAMFAYAYGFKQHGFCIMQVLQGVNLQHYIKAGIAKHAQAFVQIELQHRYAALHAGVDIGIVNFYAIACAAAVLLQVLQ